MTKRPDLMQRLMLLRHDPELVGELLVEAMKGDADAQYGLGLVYAEGRGVEQDEIEAYAWLCVSMLQGDTEAENLRDVIMHSLTAEQTHAATARAGQLVAQIEQQRTSH